MIRAKLVKHAEAAVRLKKQHVVEIAQRNEILLCSNGPRGADSVIVMHFFLLRQEKTLRDLESELKRTEQNIASSLNELEDVVVFIDE